MIEWILNFTYISINSIVGLDRLFVVSSSRLLHCFPSISFRSSANCEDSWKVGSWKGVGQSGNSERGRRPNRRWDGDQGRIYRAYDWYFNQRFSSLHNPISISLIQIDFVLLARSQSHKMNAMHEKSHVFLFPVAAKQRRKRRSGSTAGTSSALLLR